MTTPKTTPKTATPKTGIVAAVAAVATTVVVYVSSLVLSDGKTPPNATKLATRMARLRVIVGYAMNAKTWPMSCVENPGKTLPPAFDDATMAAIMERVDVACYIAAMDTGPGSLGLYTRSNSTPAAMPAPVAKKTPRPLVDLD